MLLGDQTNKNEMGRLCNLCEREEKCKQGIPGEKDFRNETTWNTPCTDVKIILKWMLNTQNGSGLEFSG